MPASSALDRWTPWLHGSFYTATGVWPLLHMRSFEWVTGPKTDKWLVQVVALLVLVQGLLVLVSAGKGKSTAEVRHFAIGSCLALAAADVKFVREGRISPIYLLDAVIEIGLAALWLRYGPEPEPASSRRTD